MPRVPRGGAAAPTPTPGALGLGMPQGALNLPASRKPTRGALGGAAPRGARMRLPPALAPAARGGKKRTTSKRKAK
jgi:hypothetical protein